MGFWVSSSYNDLLYPIPTFDLRSGMRAMLMNPEVQDAGQMWQADSGEVQTLAYWRNSYVLTRRPDGNFDAVQKFPGGNQINTPLILSPVPGPMMAETFEAHGDATTTIPAWPEKARIVPDTYIDRFGKEQTRNPVGRGSGQSQDWENPDDWVIITGTCTQMTQTCEDPPQEIQWTASARESTQRFYVDGGKPQEAYMKCNSCNGIWNETKQIVDMSQVWHWIYNEEPVRMPKGWRVDANGHITNLPIELNVSSKADALSKGVGVITAGSGNVGGRKWTYDLPCTYYTNADSSQFSESECNALGNSAIQGESEYLEWAISEIKDYANKVGIQTFWWVDAPLFTATCGDSTDANYNASAYYIDNARCSENQTNGGNGGSDESSTSWGPIIAAGTVIGLATWAATIYGVGV
jgi:hypothetical protein|tara:strand:+ start:7077 stop:8303 length:1227 start_codon:yes stop_codon:yes gene_type:complete